MKLEQAGIKVTFGNKKHGANINYDGEILSIRLNLPEQCNLVGLAHLIQDLQSLRNYVGSVLNTESTQEPSLNAQDINEALLNGTLSVGANGLPAQTTNNVPFGSHCHCSPQEIKKNYCRMANVCKGCVGCGGVCGKAISHILDGKKIKAIKEYKDNTQKQLRESKETIEKWEKDFCNLLTDPEDSDFSFFVRRTTRY